jgi:hypothetical protein
LWSLPHLPRSFGPGAPALEVIEEISDMGKRPPSRVEVNYRPAEPGSF